MPDSQRIVLFSDWSDFLMGVFVFWAVFYVLFFGNGCSYKQASHYEEYLKAAHKYEYKDRVYRKIYGEE
jgi:hypothetical protein